MGTSLVLLALAVGLLGALRRRWGASVGQDDVVGPELRELDRALELEYAAKAHDLAILLGTRLHRVVDRQVPVRAIRRAPGGRAVRVCFADGTVVIARGRVPGDFARIACAMPRQSVRLVRFHTEQQGLRLDFRWAPDQRLEAIAVGLDQPD